MIYSIKSLGVINKCYSGELDLMALRQWSLISEKDYYKG